MAGFDPSQPRAPAGTPTGGQWVKAYNAARLAAGLQREYDTVGILDQLDNPTPTDRARMEMPIPDEIRNRPQDDVERLLTYKLDKVEMPEGTIPLNWSMNRKGECYHTAAQFVLDNEWEGDKNWKLIHANLFPWAGPFADAPYNHAYAVNDELGIVYDGVFDAFFTKESYYAMNHPVDIREYTGEEAMKKMVETRIWGDWE
jgi:hypothetical protein